jgi:hypothetical protein
MKLSHRIIPLILVSVIGIASADEGTRPWKLDIDKNGIKIYTRPCDRSPINEFEGRCEIDASLYVIGMIMMDFTSYTKWVASCRDLQNLGCKDALHCTLYYVMDLPWPVTDRDAVLNASADLMLDRGRITANIQSSPDSAFSGDGKCVRLRSMEIRWVLEKITDNRTRVTFFSWAEPEGNIPAFVANMATGDMPYKTLLGLRKLAQDPRYIEAARDINEHNYKEKLTLVQ